MLFYFSLVFMHFLSDQFLPFKHVESNVLKLFHLVIQMLIFNTSQQAFPDVWSAHIRVKSSNSYLTKWIIRIFCTYWNRQKYLIRNTKFGLASTPWEWFSLGIKFVGWNLIWDCLMKWLSNLLQAMIHDLIFHIKW